MIHPVVEQVCNLPNAVSTTAAGSQRRISSWCIKVGSWRKGCNTVACYHDDSDSREDYVIVVASKSHDPQSSLSLTRT
jgi:hypothetical protein